VKARELIIAPRIPTPPKAHTGNPFTTLGDVVLDCELCGWHVMGPRADAKKAWDDHYRQNHGGQQQTGVVLLNQPKQ
jgi:hypothetical protein